jgi:hypothetical protein
MPSGPHAIRRSDREIVDPVAIQGILREGRYVTIALCDGSEPYVVTLSYGYDADSHRMYFHVALEGHKLDCIRANPAACAMVVLEGGYTQGACEHPFRSAVLRGQMRVVDDPAEKLRAIHTLVDHLEDDPARYWASRSWKLDDRLGGFTAMCLDIETVSAKQGT